MVKSLLERINRFEISKGMCFKRNSKFYCGMTEQQTNETAAVNKLLRQKQVKLVRIMFEPDDAHMTVVAPRSWSKEKTEDKWNTGWG